MPGWRGSGPPCRSRSARCAARTRRRHAGCWTRSPPGTWAASFSARRRRRTPPAGATPFKTAPLSGIAAPWAGGLAGKTPPGCRGGRPRRAPLPRPGGGLILCAALARTGRRRARLPAAPKGRLVAAASKLPPLPAAPKGTLVAAASKLPPPLQRFRAGALAGEGAEPQLRIMFPPNNARLELANDGSGKPDPIALKVTGGTGPLTVLVNGQPLPAAAGRRTLFFEPEGPGFVRLTVIDGRGATDSVMVRLQ